MNNVVLGNFSDKEARTSIQSAYRKREFDSKYFEDYSRIERIKSDLKNPKNEVISKHNISADIYEIIKEAKEHDDFWYFKNKTVKINTLKYKWFLERNGFKKYFPSDASRPTWVKINSNKVRETSTEKIKDFVLDYLIERGELAVWDRCANFQNLFSEQYLNMLESIDLKIAKRSKGQVLPDL